MSFSKDSPDAIAILHCPMTDAPDTLRREIEPAMSRTAQAGAQLTVGCRVAQYKILGGLRAEVKNTEHPQHPFCTND